MCTFTVGTGTCIVKPNNKPWVVGQSGIQEETTHCQSRSEKTLVTVPPTIKRTLPMITWQQKGTFTYYHTSLTNLLSAIDKSQDVAVNFIQKCRKLWAFENDKMFD